MKTIITLSFEGEPASHVDPSRTLTFDGAVPLPEVGEHVHSPLGGDGPISGTLIRRTYAYKQNEAHISLLLKSNYPG